jgi:hypothetical protein
MHQTDVAGVTVFGYRLTDDDLEIGLSIVPVTYIAAVETDHDAAFRDRQPGPVRRTAIDKTGPLLFQLSFDALGDTQSVFAHLVALAPDAIGRTSASNPAAAA